MRALKTLVVVMGVLLVAGTTVLVVVIAQRLSRPPAARAPTLRTQPLAGFDRTAIPAPPGSRIVAFVPEGGRLIVHLALADGREQLVVIDLASGARLGTIDMRPEPDG